MSRWLEGKKKRERALEQSQMGAVRMRKPHKSSLRFCTKTKDGKHIWSRFRFPTAKAPYFSSEWTETSWNKGEMVRWFLDKCSRCGKEKTIFERKDKA